MDTQLSTVVHDIFRGCLFADARLALVLYVLRALLRDFALCIFQNRVSIVEQACCSNPPSLNFG